MDIRNFFKKGVNSLKRKKSPTSSSGSDETETISDNNNSQQQSSTAISDCNKNDLGLYVGVVNQLSSERKKDILKNPWGPPKNYDFKTDALHLQRKFNYDWLQQYEPWLVYSKRRKGALCKYCVLFPPNPGSVRGVLGSFMVRPYLRFKNMHADCQKHVRTHLHLAATADAETFLCNAPVDVQLQRSHEKLIEENRKILSSILSCIIFCGTHDMPLRGKYAKEGVLMDLLKLRIDSGDSQLKTHFEKCNRNASYTSPIIQNEFIAICGQVIKDDIINDAKKAIFYSVLADETADVSGKEQLSIGLRFFDKSTSKIREEFVGFIELKAQDANTIAVAIEQFLINNDLNSDDCVGFGFDGCSAMAGKEAGVQAILKKKYTKALYIHCSSHKLNLVVNDASKLAVVRNCISTIKDTINFFRESTTRRSFAPSLTKLCETRWTEKYKSIRRFSENFCDVVKALEKLSDEGNYNTKKSAFQLHAAITKPVFIISMLTMAKYSAVLEPTANILQSTTIDMIAVRNHIENIISVISKDRLNAENICNEILEKALTISGEIQVEISKPRISGRQQHRSNHPASTDNEYWRRSIIIPYIDSLSASLKLRFAEENSPGFALSHLHPLHMLKSGLQDLKKTAVTFENFYGFNISAELELWYNIWQKKSLKAEDLSNIEVSKLYDEANEFFPVLQRAISILCTLPCTTATVERSFSTLRRVKTWLRSTTGEERLSGLCLMSVHRKMFVKNLPLMEKRIMDIFASNPRRLLLL